VGLGGLEPPVSKESRFTVCAATNYRLQSRIDLVENPGFLI
jgi:hypothetical protein